MNSQNSNQQSPRSPSPPPSPPSTGERGMGRISRRGFCAGSAAVATTLAGARLRAQRTPAGKFIDVHTHLGKVWNHWPELTAEGLLKWMDEHDVAKAVVMPVVSPEACAFPLTSDFVLAATKDHRDRLVPFC